VGSKKAAFLSLDRKIEQSFKNRDLILTGTNICAKLCPVAQVTRQKLNQSMQFSGFPDQTWRHFALPTCLLAG
jgi:hypothetical protein